MQLAVGRYLIISLLNFAIFGHVLSATTPEYGWMTTPVCECNTGGFRFISNDLLTGFEGKFAGHFTKITACEESCALNYGLLPCTGYFYEPNNYGKCTLFFHHGVNTNVESSPNGTASLYVKCDQVSLEECIASNGGNTVATTTLSSAEDITISCHISGDANRTQPFLGITNGTQVDLIECDNYLSVCYVNNSDLEKYRSQIECVTNIGITVNCTYTDFWLRDTHCGPEFNDSSCEMMTISCPKEELVMTTDMGEDLILLLSTQGAIYQYDLSANRKLKLFNNLSNPVAIDYWLKGSTIIWITHMKIYMCNLTKNLQFPKMIACDGNHSVLVEHNILYPVDLAVDWIHGLLFWLDLGLNTTIANTSGTYRIALDIFNERVYWVDSGTKTIASADYNGNDRRTILHYDTQFPTSLAMFEEKLYWTEWYQESVFVMNKFNGTEVRKLISGVGSPYSDRVYHNAVQPELPNKCDQHSCGNGAICLPKGNSFDNEGRPQPRMGLPYSCVCADGYTTGEEPNTCVLRT